MQGGGSEDQVEGAGGRQVLERGPHRGDCGGHVASQLVQHGGVRVGGGDGDASVGEHAGRLAGARTDLEGQSDGPTRIGEDLVDDLGRVVGAEAFVGSGHRPEAQRTLGHAPMLTRPTGMPRGRGADVVRRLP